MNSAAAGVFMSEKREAFRIRPASQDDLSVMTRLLQELFSIESGLDADPDKQRCGLEMILNSSQALALVAEHQKRVIGMVTVQLIVSTAEGGVSALLEDLIVTASCRRRGAGRALLQEALLWSRGQGARRLQLLADGRNVPALIFYRRMGWCQTDFIALKRAP